MNLEYSKELIERTILSDEMVKNVKTDDNVIMVYYKDGTFCMLELQSINFCNMQNNTDYNKVMINSNLTSTVTKVEFLESIRDMSQSNPGGYYIYMITMKLMELNIITYEIAMIIAMGISGNENELKEFLKQLFEKGKE